ncbi:MAG: MvaI/BcnI family restriction endonuclease [Bacteroidetes bacterium]|nr:MvaI/BcnI family restriction endonuclease [Bacteroidota bacterium]
MNLKNLIKLFSDLGCSKIYVKELQKNNNSKQQIYIASGDTQVLNLFPAKNFLAIESGVRKTISFHSLLDFSWLDQEGNSYPAPHSKFILYPDYPEVRFSGFLAGCKKAPSEILNNKVQGRFLFFGISDNGAVYGYAVNPEDEISQEFKHMQGLEKQGVLFTITIVGNKVIKDPKTVLLDELKRIRNKGWIDSKRLNKAGEIQDCNAPQCGGYTLEAELGIIPNGFAEPDYLGWEIKQFGVTNFERLNSSVLTLMTPEPDGGLYVSKGVRPFVHTYGYPDRQIDNRKNFGGIYKSGILNTKTNLRLIVDGFDIDSQKIVNAAGGIYLLDSKENNAASWSFASILGHWNKKHAKASYVPCKTEKEPVRKYLFGNNVILGEGTDFNLFLSQLCSGNIYYDPAVKVFYEDGKERDKRRSQFRIRSKDLIKLYHKSSVIDLDNL